MLQSFMKFLNCKLHDPGLVNKYHTSYMKDSYLSQVKIASFVIRHEVRKNGELRQRTSVVLSVIDVILP